MYGPPGGTSTLGELNVGTGSFDSVFTLQVEINALGYNVKDNRIYGTNITNTIIPMEFSRLNSDGTTTGFGFSVSAQTTIAGDCDTSGFWWGFRNGSVSRVNLSSASPTISDLTTFVSTVPSSVADYVYDVETDAFYGIRRVTPGNNYFMITVNRLTPTTNSSVSISGDVITNSETGTVGAGWGDKDGNIYLLYNQSGRIYLLNKATGGTTEVYDGAGGFNRNDGAKCVLAGNILECSIDVAGLTNEACNDNSTTSDGSDDYITFNLNPTGSNLGVTYIVSVSRGSVSPTSGTYGSATAFQMQNGSADGTSITVTITDIDDSGCQITTTVQQSSCSNACSLTDAGETGEACNDNSTDAITTDDYISFSINPMGSGLGSGYTLSVDSGGSFVGGNTGSFGSATGFRLQDGSADNTLFTVTITDDVDGSGVLSFTVQQGPCSVCQAGVGILGGVGNK